MKAVDLFNTALPKALVTHSTEAKAVNAKFQFNVTGAGSWNVDLTNTGPSCKSGTGPADCTVTIDEKHFDKLIANPKKEAVMMLMMGQLKVSGSMMLATKLESIFGYIR